MSLLKQLLTLALASTILLGSIQAQRSARSLELDSPHSADSQRDQDPRQAVEIPALEKLDYTLVFSIPLGTNGVHYLTPGGVESESETWGPASLRIAPDATFLIIDTVSNKILRYSLEGNQIESTAVIGAGAITDATVSPAGLFVLDEVNGESLVYRVGTDGSIHEKITLPSEARAKGLSGIVANDEGEIMAEMRGGSSVATLPGKVQKSKAFQGQRFSTEVPALDSRASDLSAGAVVKDEQRIRIRVKNTLGGLSVIGSGKSGDFYVLVEELSNTHTLFVDQTIQHFSADGALLGVARVPLGERYTYVRNGVSMGPDGNIYALITRPDRADVVRLHFASTVKSIIPDSEAAPELTAAGVSLKEKFAAEQSSSNAVQATACRTRDEMINTAWTYVNNRTWLTTGNLNGSCSGRIKPRFLGTAANYYSSVPYNWGGFVTVSGFNSDMVQGLLAGHIPLNDDNIRGCASGVDCSGFVSRCWDTSRKTTRSLPDISTSISVTQLERGDIINRSGVHVAMVESLANGGVNTLEATTYHNYDRVVHIWNGWSRFGGYTFYKYNNVCSVPTKVATPSISPGSQSSQGSVRATISTATSGATIRYTTNGAVPNSNSTVYSGPLTFNSTVTLKARAFKNGMTNSDAATVTYSIVQKVATPAISPGSMSSQSSVRATISTATSGATIRYTTNGADPTSNSSVYSGPLTFNSTVTLKARAFKNGLTNSDAATATYSIVQKVATPTISPGSMSSQISVRASISTATSGATIRYTTNGADPTSSSSVYSSPLTFNSTVTLKARAFKNGLTNSDVATVTYSIVANPVVTRFRYSPNPARATRVVSLYIDGGNFRAGTTQVWFVGPGCSGSGCQTNAVNVRNSGSIDAQAVLNRTGSYRVNIRNGVGAWVNAGTIIVVQ